MATLFLVLIYMTFICLGLPDSLLGAGWPVMWAPLGADVSYAGYISMVISTGTVTSSLCSERIRRRFGSGKVIVIGVLIMAAALLGFSFSRHFLWLILLAAPLGLGSGAVDAALNNHIALHYSASHLSWLHCCWSLGAVIGSVFISAFIRNGENWRGSYRAVAAIQLGVAAVLLFSLPLWKKQDGTTPKIEAQAGDSGAPRVSVMGMPGAWSALLTFLTYSAVESSTNLWTASYLVGAKGFAAEQAAMGSAIFYGSITAGRMLSGILTLKMKSRHIIRLGSCCIVAGVCLLALPLPGALALLAVLLIGLGCAPIFPNMIHESPRRFGVENSQRIIGYQMAAAFTGTTLMPPLIGWMIGWTDVSALPFLLMPPALLQLFFSERVARKTARPGGGPR